MVLQIILVDILLVARIFPRPCGARKNTTQLVKYPRVLSVKPSNKVYVLQKNVAPFAQALPHCSLPGHELISTSSAVAAILIKRPQGHNYSDFHAHIVAACTAMAANFT